ncbi:MAG: DNA polymerase IV [Fusobacteriaceae bacterium]|jgi:DNA polymerase-4|nr:DNA polymerase IV [Fusobacteriaceae bacterium]
MERQILHIDMNNFYASVECALDPSLRDKCVAVCGSVENRHGIVLAKNYPAKAFGVKTGEAVWEARQKCKDLVIVPPHYEEYMKYSRLARDIYGRYTDRIEPFGSDECWLDVSGSRYWGTGEEIAEKIRETVRFELGLTVSVGVSFNKVFAKLGSDMKKPDATTVIAKENFRDLIWGLPAEDMIGVGRSTSRTLEGYGIRTIGDLANADPASLEFRLKSRAYELVAFANGRDCSPVLHKDYELPVKSVGHGITTKEDLLNNEEVWLVMLELTQDIGRKLKLYKKLARGVAISIRDKDLFTRQWQRQLPQPSQRAYVIARAAYELFLASYQWFKPIRSVTVSAIQLCREDRLFQCDLFTDTSREEKRSRADRAVFEIREIYGNRSIGPASLLGYIKMEKDKGFPEMPTGLTTLKGGFTDGDEEICGSDGEL